MHTHTHTCVCVCVCVCLCACAQTYCDVHMHAHIVVFNILSYILIDSHICRICVFTQTMPYPTCSGNSGIGWYRSHQIIKRLVRNSSAYVD